MGDHTNIEWTDASWNPIVGCSIVSPGCTNCYAMSMARRIEAMQPGSHYVGTTKVVSGKAVWTGKVVLAPEHILTQPLRWRRPRKIFVNSMGDIFHEDVPDAWIDMVFAVMALSPQHTYQVLTKRSARMRAYIESRTSPDERGQPADDIRVQITAWLATSSWRARHPAPAVAIPLGKFCASIAWPLPNVWLGVSTEDQRRADERVPDLLATPAAIRFVSAEPLLGPINIRRWIPTCYECGASCGLRLPGIPDVERCTECGEECGPDTSPAFSDGCPKCNGELEPVCPDCGHYMVYQHPDTPNLDLVIVGGESGPNARPMHPDWARSLRDQRAAAGTAFFFKQWGEWAPRRAAAVEDLFDARKSLIVRPDGGTTTGLMAYDETAWVMDRIGKHSAGRLLDGIEHNGMPEVRP